MLYYLTKDDGTYSPTHWDGVTPWTPPDGWILVSEPDFPAWQAAHPIAVPVPQSVGPAQLRIAMHRLYGKTDTDVQDVINAMTDTNAQYEANIYWNKASEMERSNPLVGQIGAALGLTDAQVDDAFRLADTL